MKLVSKKGRRSRIEQPEMPASAMALVLKKYTEQALRKDGLSVDNLAYSKNLCDMVDAVNADPSINKLVTEKDIYFLLLFLRKTRRLPKLFRSATEEVAA